MLSSAFIFVIICGYTVIKIISIFILIKNHLFYTFLNLIDYIFEYSFSIDCQFLHFPNNNVYLL